MKERVRVAIAGLGWRGKGLIEILLTMKGVSIPAVWNSERQGIKEAQDRAAGAGLSKPEGYASGMREYNRMVERDDLDAVLIASTWDLHVPMAVAAMQAR